MAKKKISLVDRQKICEAFDFIDKNGVLDKNLAKEVVVLYNNKEYPTKYTLAVARSLQFNMEIDTSDFNSDEAIKILKEHKFMLVYKNSYQLTITKDDVSSTDVNFTMDDLARGDKCEPKMTYFVTSEGDVVYREKANNEKTMTNQTMPRIAFQIYEKEILGLSKQERLDFPTCQYRPDGQIYKGIYDSAQEMGEYYNAFNRMVYKTSNGKQFVIYSWNIFTTIIFVQECLRRFGNIGDKFVLFYEYKDAKNKLVDNFTLPQVTSDNEPPKDEDDKKYPLNQILYGPPGTGKTYNSVIKAVEICLGESAVNNREYDEIFARYTELKKLNRIEFVTFHQSYGYEEFIQGIKPYTNDGKIEYKVEDGVFKSFCEKAKGKQENFVFIIDEINRGNVSKIFGELITLIEESKRLGKSEGMEVRLPYKDNNGDDVYFGVPQNVYILGTMNTADRSLVQLDAALRRRFRFVEMMPNDEVLNDKTNVDGVDLQKLLNAINERITVLIDREHQIGHSYFTKVNNIHDLKEVFENEIIPLLQEYFYEDYEGIKIVLGNKFINDEEKTVGGITKKIYTIKVTDKKGDFNAIYPNQDQEESINE